MPGGIKPQIHSDTYEKEKREKKGKTAWNVAGLTQLNNLLPLQSVSESWKERM